ncbi:hypothetical protein [Burkholderia perseverans]|uniref:hypothetical protein n=1 Tax=Burkholderia perseverans TaxID=2615214 RepID=UPI001FEDDEBC|nr:hypothetical protein [Burkholderia perseverans]
MKVLAIGNIVKPVTQEQRSTIMPQEVPATLKLYLDGSIEQFWYRQDKPGVVFLMNVDSLDAARAATGSLPLVAEGIAEYEFMPLGPLAPLGMLIQGH